MAKYTIPDIRSTEPKDYERRHRRGRMKQSWKKGIKHQKQEEITFNKGLSWGSIGQILGYLFGDASKEFQDEVWHRIFEEYKRTKRGRSID